jgi:hypothetical protein
LWVVLGSCDHVLDSIRILYVMFVSKVAKSGCDQQELFTFSVLSNRFYLLRSEFISNYIYIYIIKDGQKEQE